MSSQFSGVARAGGSNNNTGHNNNSDGISTLLGPNECTLFRPKRMGNSAHFSQDMRQVVGFWPVLQRALTPPIWTPRHPLAKVSQSFKRFRLTVNHRTQFNYPPRLRMEQQHSSRCRRLPFGQYTFHRQSFEHCGITDAQLSYLHTLYGCSIG